MKLRIIISCLILTFGCASIPKDKTAYLKRYAREEYISLNEFARRYDFHLEFDPFLKKIFLTKGEDIVLIFALESPIALVNGQPIELDKNLKIKDGDIQISTISIKSITEILYRGVKPKIPSYKERLEIYKIKKIVLDPGHGGRDPGAIGPTGLREKDVVLEIAKKLKLKLESLGYHVVMTREDDRYISLWRRIYIANREGADLFISIHTNSSRYRRVSGFEVYYLAEASDEEARALAAAENYPLGIAEDIPDDLYIQATIWDLLYSENRKDAKRFAEKVAFSLNREIESKNRGVKSANFYVLRGAQMPAILVEVGFISNRYEEANLRDSDFKNRIASAIANGIRSYEREQILTDRE